MRKKENRPMFTIKQLKENLSRVNKTLGPDSSTSRGLRKLIAQQQSHRTRGRK